MKLAMDELAQTLFEEAGDGLFFFEPRDGHLVDVNPMAQRLTGYARHELLRLSVKALFSAEVAGGMARLFRAFQSTGLFHSQEGFLMRGAQGRTIPVNLTVTRVHARQGTLGLITARDITERRQAEEALRRSERHYRNLFENAHDAILLLDPINERVLDANRQACELYGFGRQEFIGLPLDRICPDEAGTGAVAPDADLTKTPSQTVCHRFETVHRRKDGSEILLEVNSSVIRFGNKHAVLTINRDVSERKHLEEQLRQAQKMEALGRLAGGVAHDFNNLLTVVTGYSDCLVSELPPGERCHVMAEEIRTAALRGAELTGQLLAFGRKALVAPKVLDLNAAVEQTAGML